MFSNNETTACFAADPKPQVPLPLILVPANVAPAQAQSLCAVSNTYMEQYLHIDQWRVDLAERGETAWAGN